VLKKHEPVQVLAAGLAIAFLAIWCWSIFKRTLKFCRNFRVKVAIMLFNALVWLPCGRSYLQKEQKKAQEDFKLT
jgi:hypothetical protein